MSKYWQLRIINCSSEGLIIHVLDKISIPYKKSVYGNDTFWIRFGYVFTNSVSQFRILYNELFFIRKFIYTEFLKIVEIIKNYIYGIFKLTVYQVLIE